MSQWRRLRGLSQGSGDGSVLEGNNYRKCIDVVEIFCKLPLDQLMHDPCNIELPLKLGHPDPPA